MDELDLMRDEVALKEMEVRYQAALDQMHAGTGDVEAFKALRDEFAAARSAYRANREALEAAALDGDVVVRPESVAATTAVKED